MSTTPAEIIDQKGVMAFVEKLGEERRTVEMWRYRNRLPVKKWGKITEAFPDLDPAKLVELEANAGIEKKKARAA